MKDLIRGEFIGDFHNDSFDLGWDAFDAETQLSNHAVKLDQGCAAMMESFVNKVLDTGNCTQWCVWVSSQDGNHVAEVMEMPAMEQEVMETWRDGMGCDNDNDDNNESMMDAKKQFF